MITDAKEKSELECTVCYSTHDDEIHDATLRIHHWFLAQVTRNFENCAVAAPEKQYELVVI